MSGSDAGCSYLSYDSYELCGGSNTLTFNYSLRDGRSSCPLHHFSSEVHLLSSTAAHMQLLPASLPLPVCGGA